MIRSGICDSLTELLLQQNQLQYHSGTFTQSSRQETYVRYTISNEWHHSENTNLNHVYRQQQTSLSRLKLVCVNYLTCH